MSYVLELQSKLSASRMELKRLAIQADAFIKEIHMLASPYRPILDVEAERIESLAADLRKVQGKMRELEKTVRGLERELGVSPDA